MARKSLNDIYEQLEELYLDCMVAGISSALKKQWGNNWFSQLKQIDAANAKANDNRYIIGPKTPNIDGLDFQACTKILYFLEDARNAIYAAQNYNADNDAKILARDMEEYDTVIMGRNANAHKTRAAKSKADPNLNKLELVNSMYHVLSTLFGRIKKPYDDAGRTYETIFKSYKKRFESELDKKAFLFNKYFDPEKYDYRDFLLACDTIGIDWERIEGKFWFYSDDFDADIKRLRNQLAIDSDLARATIYAPVQHSESVAPVIEPINTEPTVISEPPVLEPNKEEANKEDANKEDANKEDANKEEAKIVDETEEAPQNTEEQDETDTSFFQIPFIILISLAIAVVVFVSILLFNRYNPKPNPSDFSENATSTSVFLENE